MNIIRRAFRYLSRHVTVLVIPHTDLPLWRGRFSMAFLMFCVAAWSILTIWAGFLAGRSVDYWITKADNMVMRAKMNYMAGEIDKSRELLDMARSTDQQLRTLLGMRTPKEIIESGEGLGGPTPAERLGLARLLSLESRNVSQPAIRRSIAEVREESAKRLASFQEIAWYITNQRSLYHSTPNIWPTEGHITSPYGYRFTPFRDKSDLHSGQFHEGIDIANSPNTPIVATADGVVRYAGWASGYGMMVLVDHGFGYSTLYGHTSKVLAQKGDRVVRGQMIAYMGTTGRSTGHHLHYEVWRHGKPVNPLTYLRVHPGEKFETP